MKMHEQPRRHICTLTSAGALLAAMGAVACVETTEPTPPEPGVGQVEMRGDVEEMYTSGAFRFDIEAGPNAGQEVLVIPSTPGLPLFPITLFNARCMFGRLNARSISAPLPGLSVPLAADVACPLRFTLGASPLLSSGSSSCLDFWTTATSRLPVVKPFSSFGPSAPSLDVTYYGLG